MLVDKVSSRIHSSLTIMLTLTPISSLAIKALSIPIPLFPLINSISIINNKLLEEQTSHSLKETEDVFECGRYTCSKRNKVSRYK